MLAFLKENVEKWIIKLQTVHCNPINIVNYPHCKGINPFSLNNSTQGTPTHFFINLHNVQIYLFCQTMLRDGQNIPFGDLEMINVMHVTRKNTYKNPSYIFYYITYSFAVILFSLLYTTGLLYTRHRIRLKIL